MPDEVFAKLVELNSHIHLSLYGKEATKKRKPRKLTKNLLSVTFKAGHSDFFPASRACSRFLFGARGNT